MGKGKLSNDDVLAFLRTRIGLLDGVVLSGGECTSHRSIIKLTEKIKELGFLVKIDTNGSNPQTLFTLVNKGLVDYVALDMKAPIGKYTSLTKLDSAAQFERSLQLLLNASMAFEVRTTYHSGLLSLADIQDMLQTLEKHNYTGTFYVQNTLKNVNYLENLGYSTPLKADYFNGNIRVEIRN